MKNLQHGAVGLVLGLIIALALVVGGAYYVMQKQTPPVTSQPIACTADAKQCPDGSYVGRVGPTCDFTACPADPTVDWKTYRNEKYGFEFKYPPTYTAKTENNSKNSIVFSSDELTFGVFVISEPNGTIITKDNLRFSGNGVLFDQILSTFKFTK